MNIIKIFFTVVLTTAFSILGMACSGNSSNTNTTESSASREVALDINKVIDAYLTLKDALVASDESVASEAALQLEKVLNASDDKKAKDAQEKASAIAESNNLTNQRALFYPLSESVMELVKASTDKRKSLYVQYCPMAFDNEGAYWLSNSKDVLNPYFGDKMLRCGVVKEKL